jgi:CubicO group peptidase (beta-lactamase class C family)
MIGIHARGALFSGAFLISLLGNVWATIDGTVVDAATAAPVANAQIVFSASPSPVVTDAQGRFHLPNPADGIRVPGRTGSGFKPYPGLRRLGSRELAVDWNSSFDMIGKRFESAGPAEKRRSSDILFSDAPDSKPLAKIQAVPLYVTVQAAGYHVREANCAAGAENRIEIASDASTRFYYRIPVETEDGWAAGDANAAFPNLKSLTDMMDSVAAKKFKEVHGVLVIKGGKLVMEEYYQGNADSIDFEHGIKRILKGNVQWSRTRKHYLASCNKSLTSMVVGLALSQGKSPTVGSAPVTVATPLAQLLPKYQAQLTGVKATITVEHALTMTMGFLWDEWAGTNLADMWATQDLVGFVFSKNNAAAPGSQWIYNSGGPNILLAGMETLVGDVARFADSALYAPLGITDYRWEKQPTGQPEGSARMFMRPRDMAKLGQLYLKGGAWQGRQLVPADWVAASTKLQKSAKPKSPNDYGYLWWIRRQTTPKGTAVDYYEAEGDGGQYIVIVPAQDLVVVFTGGNYGDSQTYDGQIGRFMAKGVFPALNL